MISLDDILHAIGREAVVARQWMALNVEAAGTPQPAAELEEASDSGRTLSGSRLAQLASTDLQLYEGRLIGTAASETPLEIQAIDGTHWDIEADEHLLKRFMEQFPEAEDISA